MTGRILTYESVSVDYQSASGRVSAVDDVTLSLSRGEIFGLVGESGCGKTTLAHAALGLLPARAEIRGRIWLLGQDLARLMPEELRERRGAKIALVPQDSLAALDPTFGVGSQLVEVIRSHQDVSRRAATALALELLRRVGIRDVEQRFQDPPHRFSGGMRQRVAIAIALANDPDVVVADEPTTALDVTIQAQILALLRELREERGMTVLLITHDLAVVAEVCERVGVMYAGQLVEIGPAGRVLREPRHPYTQHLLRSLPTRQQQRGGLSVIPGEVADLEQPPPGCRFNTRCPYAMPVCSTRPPHVTPEAAVSVACWLEPALADARGASGHQGDSVVSDTRQASG